MNRWFRFGQPIGSALIILATIDTILSTFWFLLQYVDLEGKNISRHFQGLGEEYEFYGRLCWNFLICIRPLLCIFLWSGVIFWGKKLFLIAWLLLSILVDIGLISAIGFNYNLELENVKSINPSGPNNVLPSDAIDSLTKTPSWIGIGLLLPYSSWALFLGLAIFIIYRMYIILVGIQGILHLHRKYDHSQSRSASDDISDIDVCLEPIGFGFFQTWDFFKDLPGMGICILLIVELIWNFLRLMTQDLTQFMFGYHEILVSPIESNANAFTFAIYEECVMRVLRMFLGFVGLLFVIKEKLNFVRLWICIYFLGLVTSNVIFVTYLISWGLEDIRQIIFYSIYIACDVLFRILVLYYSLKMAIVHKRTFKM